MKCLVFILTNCLLFSISLCSSSTSGRNLFKYMEPEINKLIQSPRESASENLPDSEILRGDLIGKDNLDELKEESSSEVEANPDPKSSKKHAKALKKAHSHKTNKPYQKNRYVSYSKELTRVPIEMQDWLTITSSDYARVNHYPTATGTFIHLNQNYTRINDLYISKNNSHGIPGESYFWFRQNLKYIYYYENKNLTLALGNIYIDNIADARDIKTSKKCFTIFMKEDTTYKICGQSLNIKKKWLCRIQEIIRVSVSDVCRDKKSGDKNAESTGFRKEIVVQPMILIPLPAGQCNEKWNYERSGRDWQCKCSLNDGGVLQSPIDLPPPEKAIDTKISHVFEYEKVRVIAEEDSPNKLIKEGQNQKIFFRDGALRLYGNFGKVVTLDGTGYYAEEINFHTPSEHTVQGRRFDMEMKIVHKAKTKGDYGKRLTLSFFFKATPGAYNRFLDKLDFYNLPNPSETEEEIKEDIFVPNIFADEDIDGSGEMHPFSFYSYEGSITEPPCNEKTLVLVASEPIPVSISTLELFREALSMPDQIDFAGRVIRSPKNLVNYRGTMPQQGRPIFHYDKKNECPIFKKHFGNHAHEKGHYERVKRKGATYYWVSNEEPSGMPGAFVVTDQEALPHLDPIPDN